jgi:hypothetical protein
MITTSRLVTAALLSAACAGLALAQTPLLEPRFGLWEMTTTISMGGGMPGVDTSKMTPEQKARMEAMMKGMGDRTNVSKSCLKAEDVKNPNFMMQEQAGMTCTQTMNTNTRTVLDANVKCTGAREMTGQTHIELPTPTTMRSTMKMQTAAPAGAGAAGGPPTQVNITMAGKWLAADCGKEG